MRKFAVMLVLAVFAGHAYAACGGGGWKKPSLVTVPAVHTEVTHLEKPAPQPLATAVTASLGNDTEIDIGQLKLTSVQTEQAEKIQRDVQHELAQLKQEIARTQAQLEKCQGDCGPEKAHKRDLDKQLAAFEPIRETKERIYVALGICDIPTAKTTAVAR